MMWSSFLFRRPNKLLQRTVLRVSPLIRTIGQHAKVGINRMARLLKQVVNEAAGEKTPEAWRFSPAQPRAVGTALSRVGYVEDFSSLERSWVLFFPEIKEAAQNFRQQGRRERDD